jgi:glycosyltransferase involved in cell wall biosynthesis
MPVLPWLADEPVFTPAWSPQALRHFLGSAVRLQPLRMQAREELRNVRAFDLVLVNSRFSRESVLRAYGVDAKVCYLGVDSDRFLNFTGERRSFVLSVGEFDFHKNPELLIRAVGLSETKPVLQWIANRVHAGCVDSMTRLSRELGVTLELKVDRSDEELVRHYQEGLALLYAPRLEPFGLAPLEANACGMPAIAWAEGGVRETVVDGENGQVVDSPPQMAAVLDHFVRARAARALGQKGGDRPPAVDASRATERLKSTSVAFVNAHRGD